MSLFFKARSHSFKTQLQGKNTASDDIMSFLEIVELGSTYLMRPLSLCYFQNVQTSPTPAPQLHDTRQFHTIIFSAITSPLSPIKIAPLAILKMPVRPNPTFFQFFFNQRMWVIPMATAITLNYFHDETWGDFWKKQQLEAVREEGRVEKPEANVV